MPYSLQAPPTLYPYGGPHAPQTQRLPYAPAPTYTLLAPYAALNMSPAPYVPLLPHVYLPGPSTRSYTAPAPYAPQVLLVWSGQYAPLVDDMRPHLDYHQPQSAYDNYDPPAPDR